MFNFANINNKKIVYTFNRNTRMPINEKILLEKQS